jgi:hypothetical protein
MIIAYMLANLLRPEIATRQQIEELSLRYPPFCQV